ncbi:hypothetical protein [Cytobacillus sp. FSL R7-0680]|uniref:hypothetical protein n=1 Tax=Cytobacillus sp. FSL R7-0680 TaxID=2921689 RepID=UPI0030FBAEAF
MIKASEFKETIEAVESAKKSAYSARLFNELTNAGIEKDIADLFCNIAKNDEEAIAAVVKQLKGDN